MGINLSKNNAKLVKTAKLTGLKVIGFNLPAGLPSEGGTCPFAGECRKFCYASCGNFRFPNVQKSLQENYEATKSDEFEQDMVASLRKSKAQVVRLHSSGDFYSRQYVQKWIEIAKALPEVEFYAYTKSFLMVPHDSNLPANLKVIPSAGSTTDGWITGPHAKVVPAEGYVLAKDEVYGSEDDDIWNLRQHEAGKTICLKAHGSKAGKVV